MEIELIADYACVVGEGPLWHPGEQRVYWTDIDTGRVFRYDPATGEHGVIYEGEKVGGFTLQEDGSLLFFMARGAIRQWRDGEIVSTVHEEMPAERETRFNDVIADPKGRVFCGTMPVPGGRKGRLYRLDTDGTLSLILENIGCSNGMGFTPDGGCLYYTDTGAGEIYRFCYNPETGAITEQELFVRATPGGGGPDGMTVDADGNVWSARWGGSCVICHSHEDGREIGRIEFPALKVSSITFGGPDYEDMYVTTAGGDRKEMDGPAAGSLFRVRNSGVRGVPEFVSRIRIS